LRETALVLGATIPPGSYVLSWNRERGSEAVRVELASGRKVLATGKGIWVESEQPSPYEALVFRPGNGPHELVGITFVQRGDSIRIEPAASRAEAREEQSAAGNRGEDRD